MMKNAPAISQYDKMTNTPIPKLILALSVPSIISMLITNIYNLVDTAFVGQLGTSASGAVGVVFGFMAILQAFGYMFGQGAGSILSRALGEKDQEKASIYASVGFFSSFLLGVLITVFGFLFLDDVVMLLGSTPTIAPYAKTYITYILISAPFMCSSLTLDNLLRYEGKSMLGMIGLMAGAVLNMAGDPILMFGFHMDIAGAGLSTAISQVISWGILVMMFLIGKTETKITFRYFSKISPLSLWNIVTTGFSSLIRQMLNSVSTVILNTQCAGYGDAAVAAMSIVSRIVFFSFSVALGIGQGFQPVAAFNYGAKMFKRLKKSFFFTAVVTEGVIVVVCVLMLILAPQLITLFRNDADVIEIGTKALRYQAIATFSLPPTICTEMLMQATGKRLGVTILASLRNGLIFIPVLLILESTRGLTGIQEAQPLSMLLTLPFAIVCAILFFRKLPKTDSPTQ